MPNYTDKEVWKENEGKYNADEKRHYINQTVYLKDDNGIESFAQSVCLQYYEREITLELLKKCGFIIQGEYCNRQKEPWKSDDNTLIVEAIRK